MFNKIDKRQARKLWNEGKQFIIVSCNMQPDWGMAVGKKWDGNENRSFDSLVNEFSYYNCDAERGRYPAFYVEL